MKTLLLLFLVTSCAQHKFLPEAFEHTAPEQKLCFIGDTGKDTSSQKATALALQYEKCHAIYFLGDIIYPSGITSAEDRKFKELFLDYYEGLSRKDYEPKLNVIMGNHDHRGNTTAWLEIAQKYPFVYFPNHYYFKREGDLCIFALDSEFYTQRHLHSQIEPQEMWLAEAAKKEKDCKLRIALTHHPYKSSGKGHGDAVGSMKAFHEAQVLGRFDLLVSGHEHIVSHEGQAQGTALFISGAGGDPDRGFLPGYLTIEVEKKKGSRPVVRLKTLRSDGKMKVEVVDVKPVDKNSGLD